MLTWFLTLALAATPCEDKPAWLKDAFAALSSGKYPRLAALSYWHENFTETDGRLNDLKIDSSPSALKAYRSGAADGAYAAEPKFTRGPKGKVLAPPARGLYHAAFANFGGTEDDVTPVKLSAFEKLSGRRLAWAYFSNNWYDGIVFPSAPVAVLKAAGKVPFIRLMMRSREGGIPDPKYNLKQFLDGAHDEALKRWARDAKAAAVPLLLEFGTEVNGDWFPWSAKHNGGAEGPQRFRETYRRIARVFAGEGLKDVTWFFHVDANSAPEADWNTYAAYYPGDDVVDWIGVSIYGSRGPGHCERFSDAIARSYPLLAAVSKDKPLAVLEWGMIEAKTKPKPPSPKGTGATRPPAKRRS